MECGFTESDFYCFILFAIYSNFSSFLFFDDVKNSLPHSIDEKFEPLKSIQSIIRS